MEIGVNQAVVFTKPVHHLATNLTPAALDTAACGFLETHGFMVKVRRAVTGPELAAREVIRHHYRMYSEASYGRFGLTPEGQQKFQDIFDRCWEDEVAAGRIMSNPQLLKEKGISSDELFLLWNEQFTGGQTRKIQAGVLVAWLEGLDCFVLNGFYPAMEENFYHPSTRIFYYVIEFDPKQIGWAQFRKTSLGSTDASRAVAGSLRGQLYGSYPVAFPGRDNFVHGSAGPVEGLVERLIHEPEFTMASNPVGRRLVERGVDQKRFVAWMAEQSLRQVGDLFDQTEGLDSVEAFNILIEKVSGNAAS